MPFSSGTYSLPGPALAPGDTVSSVENNQFRNDVATALNQTFLRDGTAEATADLPMDGFKLIGLGAGTTSGDSARYDELATLDAEAVKLTGNQTIAGTKTFSSSPIAPTPALSDAGTTVATVAAIQALYPVGSIYLNATNATNPGTLLGFGTWTAFGAGRVLVGFNAADPLFDTAEETGGSKDATVVSHTHTATVTDPGHTHTQLWKAVTGGDSSGGDPNSITNTTVNTGSATTGISVGISTTGSSGTNANLQPYITVYMWKRTL